MAKKGSSGRKRSSRRRSSKKKLSPQETRYLVIALIIAAFILGLLTVFMLGKVHEYQLEKAKIEALKEKARLKVPTAPYIPPVPAPIVTAPPKFKNRVAIVIDDMGGSMNALDKLIEIDGHIAVAVLPFLRHSTDVAKKASSSGLEVLLHVPMEPTDMKRHDPGEGAILTNMSDAEVQNRLRINMSSVPHIIGMNNHMGSKLTEDKGRIRAVLEVVKKKGLFFLDSKTSGRSVVSSVAEKVGVRSADRNIFLDNKRDKKYIREQLRKLVKMAKKKGTAIAIGHPYPETLSVLKEEIPGLEKEGIGLVRLSELVE